MSQKTMAAAALSSMFVLGSPPALSSDKASCSPENIHGSITLNNFDEQIGDAHFKPLSETNISLSCGDRFSALIVGDFTNSDVLGYDDMRREQLLLTYKAGNLKTPLVITGGYLGEHRKFESVFASAGGRPDVGFEETLISGKIDNPDLIGGILENNFNLGDQWNLSMEFSVFGVFEQDENPDNLQADRANSSTPSFHTKTKFSNQNFFFGLEGGKIQNGVLGNAAEKYIGVFAQYKRPLNDNLNWKNSIEWLHFDNFNNQENINRNLTVISSNLEWQPERYSRLTFWGQLGATFDSVEADKTFFELGGRWDVYEGENNTLSIFGAADIGQEIEGPCNTKIGRQIGVRMNYDF